MSLPTEEGGQRPASPDGDRRASTPGAVLRARIVETDGERIVMTLPNGDRAIARGGGSERGLNAGQSVDARVLGVTAENLVRVELLVSETHPVEDDPFDKEIGQLADALRERSSALSARNAREEPSIDGRITRWIAEATRGLDEMEAHRGGRLSRDLYDEGESGGAHAKRRGRDR